MVVKDGWVAKLPDNRTFMDVAAEVVVDSKDQVLFVFNRGEHPMVVFDRNGNFLREWGKTDKTLGLFTRAHGLHIGPDDMLYIARMTQGDHTVRKITPDGKVILEIGVPGEPTSFMSG